MNGLKLGVGALGLACCVAGALLPQVMFLIPVGTALLGWLAPSNILEGKKNDSQN